MNNWERCELLLSVAQDLVEEMQSNNDDRYELLISAKEHIMAARGDLDADLK